MDVLIQFFGEVIEGRHFTLKGSTKAWVFSLSTLVRWLRERLYLEEEPRAMDFLNEYFGEMIEGETVYFEEKPDGMDVLIEYFGEMI